MTIAPDIVSLYDYERAFLAHAEASVKAYIAGAAADGITHRRNRDAFDRLELAGRVLCDMSHAHTRLRLFGRELDCPIVLAPVSYHKLAHPEGEVATAIGARAARMVMTVSTQASMVWEDIAAATDGPKWFQLYLQRDDADTLDILKRVEGAGYEAIMVTVDAPVNGIRNMEQRAGFSLPAEIASINLRPGRGPAVHAGPAESPVFKGLLDGAATWDKIGWLKSRTPLPVILKGIMHPDDARRAIECGVDGIAVSNHGGRVIDSLPASMSVLPSVAVAVNGRVPILVDGGIRRGTDIVKALALGATAVMVGRPQLYALGIGGAAGVAHMLTILRTELEVAMALTGCATLNAIDQTVLWRDV